MTTEQILINLLSGAFGAFLILVLQWLREYRRQRYERRLYILRSIMANIQNIVSYDFVSAFNLIMLEYTAKSTVRKWHTEFIKHVSLPTVEREAKRKDFDNILVKLVDELAKSIGITMEQLDIQSKIYWPTGFIDTAQKQQKLIDLLIKNGESWDKIFSKNDVQLTIKAKKSGNKKAQKKKQ